MAVAVSGFESPTCVPTFLRSFKDLRDFSFPLRNLDSFWSSIAIGSQLQPIEAVLSMPGTLLSRISLLKHGKNSTQRLVNKYQRKWSIKTNCIMMVMQFLATEMHRSLHWIASIDSRVQRGTYQWQADNGSCLLGLQQS
ncbi:hypothetical protein OPV22_008635 [Ensete ventricosum]|uniref:Uncharacterized protein n=1 Tax=Ensete ventricosum TaxID=4639 RepID=A0AAV8R3D3_ENSVE|nr:hypothetical protein OPV22_008635 [Ensete ventricosum]